MKTLAGAVSGLITYWLVHVTHGPDWAAAGMSLTTFNVWLAADTVVEAVRRNRTKAAAK